MPRYISPGYTKKPSILGLLGKVVRIPGTMGIEWLVSNVRGSHHEEVRLISIPNGHISLESCSMLISRVAKGVFIVEELTARQRAELYVSSIEQGKSNECLRVQRSNWDSEVGETNNVWEEVA